MKIDGKKIMGANESILVIPRFQGEDIIFKLRAIVDNTDFEKMCPTPQAPKRLMAGGQEIINVKDKGYLDQVVKHSELRLSWLVLKTLEPTNLEWENVKLDIPTTWSNFKEEMTEAGFNSIEIQRLINECFAVNALNEAKIEEARESFLRGLQAVEE